MGNICCDALKSLCNREASDDGLPIVRMMPDIFFGSLNHEPEVAIEATEAYGE
jgi:hypothetical protein